MKLRIFSLFQIFVLIKRTLCVSGLFSGVSFVLKILAALFYCAIWLLLWRSEMDPAEQGEASKVSNDDGRPTGPFLSDVGYDVPRTARRHSRNNLRLNHSIKLMLNAHTNGCSNYPIDVGSHNVIFR